MAEDDPKIPSGDLPPQASRAPEILALPPDVAARLIVDRIDRIEARLDALEAGRVVPVDPVLWARAQHEWNRAELGYDVSPERLAEAAAELAPCSNAQPCWYAPIIYGQATACGAGDARRCAHRGPMLSR